MKVTSQHVGGKLAGTESASGAGKANKTNSPSTASGSAAAGPSPLSTEKVNLSQRVQDLQKIKELATPEDSINEAKVAHLQKLIDGGEYKADADAIADRLVDEHLNFPS